MEDVCMLLVGEEDKKYQIVTYFIPLTKTLFTSLHFSSPLSLSLFNLFLCHFFYLFLSYSFYLFLSHSFTSSSLTF